MNQCLTERNRFTKDLPVFVLLLIIMTMIRVTNAVRLLD